MKKDFSKLKVLNITHHDMDGVGCAIVLCNYFENVKSVPVSYTNLDSVISQIGVLDDYTGFDIIFTTDLNLNQSHIDHIKSLDIMFFHLDHHLDVDGIDNGGNILVDPTRCGALITKDFLEFNMKTDLSHLNELVNIIDDYDRWVHKLAWSKPLNYLYEMYGFPQFKDRFMDGFFAEFTDMEVRVLTDIGKKIDNFWESVEKTMIISDSSRSAVIYTTTKYLNDMSDKVLKSKKYNVDVVFAINIKTFKGHVRTSLPDLNMGGLFTKLGVGGGHRQAAGFACKLIDDTMEESMKSSLLLDDIQKYESIIMKVYPDIKL